MLARVIGGESTYLNPVTIVQVVAGSSSVAHSSFFPSDVLRSSGRYGKRAPLLAGLNAPSGYFEAPSGKPQCNYE